MKLVNIYYNLCDYTESKITKYNYIVTKWMFIQVGTLITLK